MSERIETIIAEAAETYFRRLERDGYRPEGCSGAYIVEDILAALKAARIAVVELPEPEAETANTAVWKPVQGMRVNRNVSVVIDPAGEALYPHQARTLAAALLAAADAVEVSA